MAFVRMDPPGTFCHRAAILDFIRPLSLNSFVEVGVGDGSVSKLLLRRGLSGLGIERSQEAVERAQQTIAAEIHSGQYRLVSADLLHFNAGRAPPADLGVALMVLEHIPDDVGFLRALKALVHPGGYLLVSVPARKDRWSLEDETVGHLRRYEKEALVSVLQEAGLGKIETRSVAVPVANVLYRMGNIALSRHGEASKRNLSAREQTDLSGIRDIPYKTTFPRWCRVILNSFSMYPFCVLQRAFYDSSVGLELMALAEVV